jgi:hypothetical protein
MNDEAARSRPDVIPNRSSQTIGREAAERAGRFVENAHRLAELGWPLIRLDGKVPRGKDWQHTEPLRDPHQVAGFWAEWGKRWNMGVVLGAGNLAVLEYDLAEARPRFVELIAETEPPLCRTGSGKHHAYFAAVNGVTKAARDGLELRVGAHQCVVPPSVHPDTGQSYVWERAPWDVPLPPLPDAIVAYFAGAGDELRRRLQSDPGAKVHPGQRRDQVFRLACSLVARGVPPDAILTTARAFNETRCDPPLEDAHVVEQVGGAGRYQPGTALARNVGGTANALNPSIQEKRGVPSDFPGGQSPPHKLQDVIDAFGELLVMPDPGAIEVALASIVANYARGDSVWQLLVGPPGCGKSEIVTALTNAPSVWALSSLTPQTLLSGFERKGRDTRPPASMLLQIGPFGILAFKDLTTVLTMHREARSQIIGQLREVADGKTEKSFGNGLRIEWEGKLGMIAGVTPVIDEQHAFLAVMGERFVLYRLPEVTRRAIARRSLERRGHEAELRERIRMMVAEFLAGFRSVGRLELPGHFTEPLITLTDIVTRARSGVARDYQTREILYLPEPEAPTRLAKQIAQLMAAALAIGVDEKDAWRIARKVGWDSVPAVRSAVIHLLARHEGEELTRAELMERTGLPETTIRRVEEDLVVLGLAEHRKESDATNARWLIRESTVAREYWDSPERTPETAT